jgi:lysophospholipase-2
MHGLGDTAAGFEDVAMMWAKQMPHVKWILPTATTQPVTMNMGMPMPSWYDIVGLDERSNENCAGIDESAARINKYLSDEHSATSLPYSRMVLSGFSQGGALSLYAGLQRPDDEKIGGVLCMSGYLAGAKTFQLSNAGKSTPVMHCHGTVDPMVRFAMAEKTQEKLKEQGIENYTLKPYPIQHTVTHEEIVDALGFLNSVVPPDPSCDIKPKAVEEMSVKELKAAIQAGGLGRQAVGLSEKQELVKLLKDNQAK